jgi:dodecin
MADQASELAGNLVVVALCQNSLGDCEPPLEVLITSISCQCPAQHFDLAACSRAFADARAPLIRIKAETRILQLAVRRVRAAPGNSRRCGPQSIVLRGVLVAMLKVIEVLAESSKSWEDAAQTAVGRANETVRNVRSIYIKNLEAKVENGRIKTYRINAKISFSLEG